MKFVSLCLAASLVCAISAAGQTPSLPPDVPGKADLPNLKRFAGSRLVDRIDKPFDEFSFATGKRQKDGSYESTKKVEGRVTRLIYVAPKDNPPLEVSRNYRDSIIGGGAEVLFECADEACGVEPAYIMHDMTPAAVLAGPQVERDWCATGKGNFVTSTGHRYFVARLAGTAEAYVAVVVYQLQTTNSANCKSLDGATGIVVAFVQPRAMEDKMVTVKAAEMAATIGAQGRIALYGIYFDTGKAVVKAESDPTLTEIAALLKGNGALRLLVVGHTDWTGDLGYNVTLSMQRAAAVTQALTSRFGIAPNRLRPEGVGMLAPAAANDTDEGRARNRRVELVKLP